MEVAYPSQLQLSCNTPAADHPSIYSSLPSHLVSAAVAAGPHEDAPLAVPPAVDPLLEGAAGQLARPIHSLAVVIRTPARANRIMINDYMILRISTDELYLPVDMDVVGIEGE